MQLLINLLVAGVLFSTGNCDSCEGNSSREYLQSDTQVRPKLFQSLENALIQDEANLYHLKKVFFYGPNADPVLLRVVYGVTFGENITDDVLPYCPDATDENSTLNLNQSDTICGWTSRGLYQWIEPLALSRIQMALPFCILRWTQKWFKWSSNPEIASFLWDGSESHPLDSLRINLHITSMPCIPSEEIFKSTVEELTIFVS